MTGPEDDRREWSATQSFPPLENDVSIQYGTEAEVFPALQSAEH